MFNIIPQVLVVDDNPLSRTLMGYYLRNLGCHVFEAEDGAQSLIELRNHKYDLIILDWNMPKLNGHDTLIQGDDMLKKRYMSDKKVPVLIYTNSQLNELNIPECDKFSVRATLSKKLTPFQQLKKIKDTLDHLF